MISRNALSFLFLVFGTATLALLALNASGKPAVEPPESACPQADGCQTFTFADPLSPAEQLAAKHAPIVYLPELDQPCRPGGSSLSPIPIEAVLDNPAVALRRLNPGADVIYGPSASDLWEAGHSVYFQSYLDLPGDPLKPGCQYERDALRLTANSKATVYARLTTEDEMPGLILQYWLFYYFNDWNNKHEADWELIQLYFDTENVATALEQGPSQIGLSQHRGGSLAMWTDEKLTREGQRPVVYVARGSHANYFRPGVYLGRGEAGRGLGCDDAAKSTRRVPLEAELLPQDVAGPHDPYAWLAYKGYWGEVDTGTEGSTAPMTKQTWLQPYGWQQRLQPQSIPLPAKGLIGPDPARSFCNLISFGSNFVLPLYRDLPIVSLVLLAMMPFGVLASLASTRYLPAQVTRLHVQRRLGQIMTTSVSVYTRHWQAFLTLGLLTFPIGMLFAASPATLVPPALPGLPLNVPYHDLGLGVGSALMFHGLTLGLTGIVVFSASVAIIGQIGKEDRCDAATALWATICRLPHLILINLVGAFVIAALCLTIIGIPLAVRQAALWSLNTQALLLRGASPWSALRSSAVLISRSRWHAMTTLAVLTMLALLAASATGIILLWFAKTLPPAYVGLITASLHALLLPYLAIALSLLYFDLEARGPQA